MIYKIEDKVANTELSYEIIVCKGTGKLSKRAESLFITLASNAQIKFTYYNEQDKDDCLQDALYRMLTKWQSYNPEKTPNAFAYFTEMFKRASGEGLDKLYSKKGLKKDELKKTKFISMNNINSGQGMYNI